MQSKVLTLNWQKIVRGVFASWFKAQRRKLGSQWPQGGFCQGFAPRDATPCEVPSRAGAHRLLPWRSRVRPCMPQGAASRGPPGKSFAKGQAAKCVRRLLESRGRASASGWSRGVYFSGATQGRDCKERKYFMSGVTGELSAGSQCRTMPRKVYSRVQSSATGSNQKED